jgi:hypothetical protein
MFGNEETLKLILSQIQRRCKKGGIISTTGHRVFGSAVGRTTTQVSLLWSRYRLLSDLADFVRIAKTGNQCYKKFYTRNLLMFLISKSVGHWQAFPE